MRTLLFVSFFLFSHVLLAQRYSSFIKDLPRPARVVNDFGNFLLSSEENALEKELISYRKKTGNAIVIITLSTLTDNKTGTTWSVEETSLQYFSKWGIGDKKKNNGVLLLISKEPRRVRITTGTGVENKLPDNECQRIVNETIVPKFKSGMIYAGLREGVNDIEVKLGGAGGGKVYNESDVQSGSGTGADNWATTDEPVQTEAQPLAQPQQSTPYVSAYENNRRPPTVGETILGFLLMALVIWLRVQYVRKNDQGSGNNVTDYLNATGWTFLWMLKIVFGIFILFFLLFKRRGGGYRRNSYYNGYDDGYDRGRSHGRGSSSVSSGSYGGGGGSGSSEGSGSYGGGRSNGGGASGSW
jgi:uncharacterized protein